MRERERQPSSQQGFYAGRDVNCGDYHRYFECCDLAQTHWIYGKNKRFAKAYGSQKYRYCD